MTADVRIGISGWTYKPWRGTFYPEDLPQKQELAFAAQQFNSIEINGSFYGMLTPTAYQAYHRATPAGFVFSVKAGRYLTHLRRLRDVETPLANFMASGLLALREKLGPILWQLPPSFRFDEGRLRDFLALLPPTTAAAARLARKRDERMRGRSLLTADADRPLRHAMEIRHDSFRSDRFLELLAEHNVALVVADTAGKWPYMEELTADFVYVRLHGDAQLYVSGYTPTALDRWADKIRAWSAPARRARSTARDVYVYFDNDVKVRAPFDALALARRLGLHAPDLPTPDFSAVTEQPRERWPAPARRRPAKARRAG